jgi:hypothetical protein
VRSPACRSGNRSTLSCLRAWRQSAPDAVMAPARALKARDRGLSSVSW